MTTAEKVAELLGNDGTKWETEDGRGISEVTREHGARVERGDGRLVRYQFPDGSGIIVAEGAWDLALSPKCWCWAGAGHIEGCKEGK